MTSVIEKLEKHAQQIATREECFLYDLELVGSGRNKILRVFIDKEGNDGVSIDDCSKVSRGLDLILDVEDLVPGGEYQLEVSSPGLERPLSKSWHFTKAKGENISVQLISGLGMICSGLPVKEAKRKKLSGKIIEANENEVIVAMSTKNQEEPLEIHIGYEHIHKAKVIFEFNKLNKQPKKKK